MFAYCGNNPVDYADVSGNHFERSAGGGGGGGPMYFGTSVPVPTEDARVAAEITASIVAATVITLSTAGALDEKFAYKSWRRTQEKEEAKAIPATPTISSATYYGADIYGKVWKTVTGPLSYEQAIAWVHTTAAANVYGRNASWGLYTNNATDAFSMASTLDGFTIPIYHGGKIGEYDHFHVSGFLLFDRYKHFHVWYGNLN